MTSEHISEEGAGVSWAEGTVEARARWCNRVCLKNNEKSAQQVIHLFTDSFIQYLLSIYYLSDTILEDEGKNYW